MQVMVSEHNGVLASVYVMNPGDMLPRHSHDMEHTVHVLVGAAEIQVYDGRPIFLLYARSSNQNRVVLPPVIEHEVRAILPGTVLLNMMNRNGKLLSIHGQKPEQNQQGQGQKK